MDYQKLKSDILDHSELEDAVNKGMDTEVANYYKLGSGIEIDGEDLLELNEDVGTFVRIKTKREATNAEVLFGPNVTIHHRDVAKALKEFRIPIPPYADLNDDDFARKMMKLRLKGGSDKWIQHLDKIETQRYK